MLLAYLNDNYSNEGTPLGVQQQLVAAVVEVVGVAVKHPEPASLTAVLSAVVKKASLFVVA